MRGEICIGSASVLSFAALVMLIFVHVGQINTSTVPRGISMVQVNVSGYGQGLAVALGDPIEGLYTDNASAPLEDGQGLRQLYKFGLYSHCGYINGSHGICSNVSAANRFEPLVVTTADMLANYTQFTDAIITQGTFVDSNYLGDFTNGAYYLILIGTVATALALITGFLKHTFLFLLSTAFAIIGALALLIGATIWTVMIEKCKSVNDIMVGTAGSQVPLGIFVSTGSALFLLWASWACLLVSILPYMIRLGAIASAVLVLAAGAHALQKVSRAGRYLYTDDGNRFFIKGIAYQEQGTSSTDPNNPFSEPSSFIDPLTDGAACQRDITFLKQLTVNAVRIYSVNSSLNHDDCMKALSDAGIYTIIDLALPVNGSIDRLNPSWTTNLLDLYIGTINAFNKYDNVLAYNIGNEVITAPAGTGAAPFIKAAARDVRAYLNSISSSALVGYAAIDGDDNWVLPLAEYLSCDPTNANSGSSAIDLFGLNNYEWCGDDTPSAYSGKNGDFAGYNVAAYFSEFGCVKQPPRLWTEVGTIFSQPMSDIWSGGIAFSYFPQVSDDGEFGMVTIDGNTVTPNDDFGRLVDQYGKVTFPTVPSKSDAGAGQYPSCPPQNSTWLATNTLPPTPNDASCKCLESTLSCLFTPKTTNTSAIVGSLLDFGCSSLGSVGGNCDDISANGTTGTYGRVAFCDPDTKLSFVMSEFYELTNRVATSCDFSGNATVNQNAPSSVSGANAAASSCLSNPSAIFTPSAPASTSGASGSSGTGGSGGGNNNNNGAIGLLGGSPQALLGLGVAFAFSLVGSVLTVA
ncbi:carbohydrate-binding module family 43 protein [Polyporus arcularius HHB13444]|uniref:1,3-beta-glucanosyltransferase n=1 Tax=Polyporus arcularius HHB13444 TaxID=1314778 RepID=A0A5C3PXN3_9APHY|nr:carbohydrate-binding module family 43 protein [Polyporus arcularius HHB13444]